MEKTADELFEELGYTKEECDNGVCYGKSESRLGI